MARKAIVDKDVILDMLKAGETTQRIADRFGVSRQAIDLHRKDFIAQGILADKRAVRRKSSALQATFPTEDTEEHKFDRPESITRTSKPSDDSLSLDDHIDLLINAFSALKRITILEKELEICKSENERIISELERLKNIESRRLEQETRWTRIQTEPASGDSSPPIQNSML